jgi:hypothetical protein
MIANIASGKWMFVLRQDGFQKIFRYYEMVRQAAAESLSRIEATIPILNFAGFRQDCEGHLKNWPNCATLRGSPTLIA